MRINSKRLEVLYRKYAEKLISEDELVEFYKTVVSAKDKDLNCILANDWDKDLTEIVFTRSESERIFNAILNLKK